MDLMTALCRNRAKRITVRLLARSRLLLPRFTRRQRPCVRALQTTPRSPLEAAPNPPYTRPAGWACGAVGSAHRQPPLRHGRLRHADRRASKSRSCAQSAKSSVSPRANASDRSRTPASRRTADRETRPSSETRRVGAAGCRAWPPRWSYRAQRRDAEFHALPAGRLQRRGDRGRVRQNVLRAQYQAALEVLVTAIDAREDTGAEQPLEARTHRHAQIGVQGGALAGLQVE